MYLNFTDIGIFHVIILFCAKSQHDHQLQIRHIWHNSTVNTCMSKDCIFSLKLGNITKSQKGDLDSSYCIWYSKAKQNILSAIYLVIEYCLASQINKLMCYLCRYSHQNIAYFCKLGDITKRGDFNSSYCRWYSKAKQQILSVI